MCDDDEDSAFLDAAILEGYNLCDLDAVVRQLEGEDNNEESRGSHLRITSDSSNADEDLETTTKKRLSYPCSACGNTDWVCKHYGVSVCSNCAHFIARMVKRGFSARCEAQGKCDTSHAPNRKIRCSYCRIQVLLKLDIDHPAWIEHKKRCGYKSDSSGESSAGGGIREKNTLTTRRAFVKDRKDSAVTSPASLRKKNGNGKPCDICKNEAWTHLTAYGFNQCANCLKFLKRTNRPHILFKCLSGQFDCRVQHLTMQQVFQGLSICSGCRLKRAIDLGFKTPITDAWLRENNLQRLQSASEKHPSAIDAIFVETEDDPPRTDERADDEAAVAVDTQKRGPVDQSKTIQIINMDDLESPVDGLDLPLDVNQRFSRWLYADLSQFRPGCRNIKTSQDEVSPPRPAMESVIFSNDISSHRLPLLTQNLDFNERPPLEEITVPKIDIQPSKRLLRAQSMARHRSSDHHKYDTTTTTTTTTTAAAAATQPTTGKVPKLIIKVEIQRTTIDRRPMLQKRFKNSYGLCCRSYLDPNEVFPSALIGPGEDCDESDEIEVIELDCD